MKAELRMQLSQQQGSLERVLRVIRHRGFHISSLNVSHIESTKYFEVLVAVESERSMSLLEKQLNKLFDVSHLHVAEEVCYAQTA